MILVERFNITDAQHYGNQGKQEMEELNVDGGSFWVLREVGIVLKYILSSCVLF